MRVESLNHLSLSIELSRQQVIVTDGIANHRSSPHFDMRLFALASILALAAAAPQARGEVPKQVKIIGISLLGSGCPAGSADVQIDVTGSLFEATFSQYEVQTGPRTSPVDWRKNCKLTINMQFDPGFQ